MTFNPRLVEQVLNSISITDHQKMVSNVINVLEKAHYDEIAEWEDIAQRLADDLTALHLNRNNHGKCNVCDDLAKFFEMSSRE